MPLQYSLQERGIHAASTYEPSWTLEPTQPL